MPKGQAAPGDEGEDGEEGGRGGRMLLYNSRRLTPPTSSGAGGREAGGTQRRTARLGPRTDPSDRRTRDRASARCQPSAGRDRATRDPPLATLARSGSRLSSRFFPFTPSLSLCFAPLSHIRG